MPASPQRIRKAVFPVAGLGTRFLPATKAVPKEMLPVVDRPVIQHVVDEARSAGIEHFVFVTGRNKGAIEDHFDRQPELEATLLAHPAVADAAVIPIPDEEAGEVPKAFVVLRSDVPTDQIMSFVAERVAPYKRLRVIEAIDQIPKSPSGKILRRMLVERERAGA